jgi:hypothetical protein
MPAGSLHGELNEVTRTLPQLVVKYRISWILVTSSVIPEASSPVPEASCHATLWALEFGKLLGKVSLQADVNAVIGCQFSILGRQLSVTVTSSSQPTMKTENRQLTPLIAVTRDPR